MLAIVRLYLIRITVLAAARWCAAPAARRAWAWSKLTIFSRRPLDPGAQTFFRIG